MTLKKNEILIRYLYMKQAFTIIGAGIGGLTAAMLLQQNGFDITVYESAAAIEP